MQLFVVDDDVLRVKPRLEFLRGHGFDVFELLDFDRNALCEKAAKAGPCEVLLDNEVWNEMQAEMAAVDWPSGQDFYSVRVFLVVQDK